MLLMFVSRAWSCGILIEKPKYAVFVCKSFADFAEIPLAGPECPSHVIYLRSDVPLFVTRCFSEPLDFWEEEPHTHIDHCFSSASVLPHWYTTLFTEKPAAGGFSLLTLVSH